MINNFTFQIVVPQIKPFFYVKNNKIVSDSEDIKGLLTAIPKLNQKLIPINTIAIGSINKTGHYSGLLGYIQRLEADLIYYPIPLDISDPPGTFGSTIRESGTRILTVSSLSQKKNSDISEFFLHFDLKLVFLVFFNFFFLAFFIYKLSQFSLTFFETTYILFQSLFKEQVLNKFNFKKPFFVIALLFYHHVLSILIEANVNTSLVVYDTPHSINTLNDLYVDEKKTPYFVKEHFSNDYFTNKYKNKIADTIYKRAEKCGECIIESKEIINKISKFENTNFAIISELVNLLFIKNILCNKKHEFINPVGTTHLSLEIYKVLYATILRKNIEKIQLKIYNKKIYNSFESGIITKSYEGINKFLLTFVKSIDKGQKTCLTRTNKLLVKSNFNIIQFNNIKIFSTVFLMTMILYFLFFAIKYFWNK